MDKLSRVREIVALEIAASVRNGNLIRVRRVRRTIPSPLEADGGRSSRFASSFAFLRVTHRFPRYVTRSVNREYFQDSNRSKLFLFIFAFQQPCSVTGLSRSLVERRT